MKCPFRKRIIYAAGRNTGFGYPLEWIASEEFEECIGEKCPSFYLSKTHFPESKTMEACQLCERK